MLLAVQIVFIKLRNEKKKICSEQNLEAEGNCKKKGDCLVCKPPFYLHTFPGPIKCKQLREAWIKVVRRESFDKKGYLATSFKQSSLFHLYVDGLGTDENPIPTFFLDYENKEKKSRRTLFQKLLEKKLRDGGGT